MTQVSGRVEKIYSKEYKPGKFMYSVVVNGTFYGVGGRKPSVVEGDNVSFQCSQNGKFWNVEGNIEVTGRAPAATAASGVSGAVPAANDRQLFEERKQTAIALQSARNSALETVGILLTANAIKLPAKQADGMDVILALVDEVTDRYFNETKAIYRGEDPREQAKDSTAQANGFSDLETDFE